MTQKDIKTVRIVGKRPTEATEGWEVYNASRPLWGNTHWQGDFKHGVFYAAIDPTSQDAQRMRETNISLDAWKAEWVDEETWKDEVVAYAKKRLEKFPDKSVEDFKFDVLEELYLNSLYR